MLKTKFRIGLIAIIMFSLVAMYGFLPMANAASLTNVKDTVSDSESSATAVTHVLKFQQTSADLTQNQYISINFGSFTGDVEGNVTCPANSTASTTNAGTEVGCVVDAGQTLASTTIHTITVTGMTNPTTGSYPVVLTTYTSGDVAIDNATARVYVLSSVTVQAHVDASLTFQVQGVNPGTSVNGITTNGTSTATLIDFGTLPTQSTGSTTIAQSLLVSTNASAGYSVTVEQDGELVTAGGANINSFNNAKDGTGSSTVAVAWAGPSGTLGSDYTYGHMGVTSDDTTNMTLDFSSSKYAGLAATAPMEVMAHNGAANNSGTGVGQTYVGYTIEITDLQEAGDYTAALTYIVTPTF